MGQAAPAPDVHPELLQTLKKLADGVDELRHFLNDSETRQNPTADSISQTSGTLTTRDVIKNVTSSNLQDSTVTGREEPESPPKWLTDYLGLHAPTEENLLLLKTELKSNLEEWLYSFGFQIELTDPWRQLLRERVDMEWPSKIGTLGRAAFNNHILEIQWDLRGLFGELEFGGRLEYMNGIRGGHICDGFGSSAPVNTRPSVHEIWTCMSGNRGYLNIPTLAFILGRFKRPYFAPSFNAIEDGMWVAKHIISFDPDFDYWGCRRWTIRGCGLFDEDLGSFGVERERSIFNEGAHRPWKFPLQRQKGRIGSLFREENAKLYFKERLFTTYMQYGNDDRNNTWYTIFNWRDSNNKELTYGLDRDAIGDYGKDGEAFAAFFSCILRESKAWADTWTETLNKVDDLVGIQLEAALNNEHLQTLMFDRSFRLSEQYFSVLQMLRIFHDWTEQTKEYNDIIMPRFRQYLEYLNGTHKFDLKMGELMSLAEMVDNQVDSQAKSLISRIEKKQVEIESLRDGLFNASSLREAVQARTLNLFVIVFTILTIIYTPLGFLATLWAIPNLAALIDGGEGSSTPISFYVTWIGLPIGTYIAATFFLVLAWGSSSPEGKNFVSDCRAKLTGIIKQYRKVLPWSRYPEGNRLKKFVHNAFIAVPLFPIYLALNVLGYSIRFVKSQSKSLVGFFKASL